MPDLSLVVLDYLPPFCCHLVTAEWHTAPCRSRITAVRQQAEVL